MEQSDNKQFTIRPSVDETQEFIEITNDFSNPLELVREAISNSFDAKANTIWISFDVIREYGESVLEIKLKDNGKGMDKEGLHSFFDLGNSSRRGDSESIGEKGHGTKIYLNSKSIEVITQKSNEKYTAVVQEPYKTLYDRQIPIVQVTKETLKVSDYGTEIIIKGYNNNRRNKFTHEILKDYIYWFTKFGSIELNFNKDELKNSILYLKGLNREKYEKLEFGHIFPPENHDVSKLFDKYLVKAPEYYCKKIVKTGQLKNFPEIKYEAIFYIEGNNVKQSYNPMLRRRGYQAPKGAYTVQERYGIWLCKDYIPIQKKNEWITYKGSEFTKFHAFLNCQELRLTANRGSIENTPHEILDDIKDVVYKEIYSKIVEGDDWRQLEWLEEEADGYRTTEKEKNDFKWRKEKINKSNIATYRGLTLVQPEKESGVFALTIQLLTVDPELLPFQILDYDTHSGIDVIVKGDHTTPIHQSKLYYVEFKKFLQNNFNHTFVNLHSIICWETDIKHGDIIEDINKEKRKMIISAPTKQGEYTKYFLDDPRNPHKIEVFVLKHYLKEKLNIEFIPRTSKEVH
ncbi:ATP-binding protein [Sporolactobacillus laevolacticus]|uniref:ATP-binding protein n=1 Tax=Sporolactobacillus laevolacticus TaxID=33018 RepID=UPI0025B5F605|nr:ATP-binding protein [Sporolactobacillus laevolacticus]MDN3956160.1 ATP-binding protein [Sporolactobacillus laevolacticus]